MKRLIIVRRISQFFFFFLFLYILWSTTYPLHGRLPASLFFRIDPLVTFFISISGRVILPGVVLSMIMVLFTLMIGRFFCGWVCPLGFIIDMAGAFNKRRKEEDGTNRILSRIKFYLLLAIALLAVLGIQVVWILDPIVIGARFVSLNLIPFTTASLNKIFIFIIKVTNFPLPLYDFYRLMKRGLLGISPRYFSASPFILLFFISILALALYKRRLWCRSICPLGALYGAIARFSFLRRSVGGNCTACGRCHSNCRMGAIKKDIGYSQGECVMCMDCIYDCPENAVRFRWRFPVRERTQDHKGITRREFLYIVILSFILSAFRYGRRRALSRDPGIIRPPGVLGNEDRFLDSCIRCGNCMKVCITNGLQPVMLEATVNELWSPRLVPEIGYCEYNCTLCGQVCPTGAIPRLTLEKKKRTRLGIAKVNRSLCIAWSAHRKCLVCEEHCPVQEKAINISIYRGDGKEIGRPYVEPALCIGCGLCQNKCPVRPVRAIRVFAVENLQDLNPPPAI